VRLLVEQVRVTGPSVQIHLRIPLDEPSPDEDIPSHVNSTKAARPKLTIARMIAALERPTTVRILVGGVELASLSRTELRRRRRNVHLMFLDPSRR